MTKEVLAEQIADRLRRDILKGSLAPGATIKERDIAEGIGVSRTPIREAVRMLAQESLVELRPSRSPIVIVPDLVEVEELTTVLIALEKLSARLACQNALDAEIDHMAHLVEEVATNYNHADTLDVFEIDMAFHTAIAKASGNTCLAETHGTFLRRLWRARYLAAVSRRDGVRVIDEHGAILDALRRRDEDAAEAAVNAHLWHFAEDIRELIEQEHEIL